MLLLHVLFACWNKYMYTTNYLLAVVLLAVPVPAMVAYPSVYNNIWTQDFFALTCFLMKLFKYGNNSRMSALFWIVSSELTERKRNKFVNNDNNVSLFWRLVMTMISQSVLVVVICYLYISKRKVNIKREKWGKNYTNRCTYRALIILIHHNHSSSKNK